MDYSLIIQEYKENQRQIIERLDNKLKLKGSLSMLKILDNIDKYGKATCIEDILIVISVIDKSYKAISSYLYRISRIKQEEIMAILGHSYAFVRCYAAVSLYPVFIINKSDTKIFSKLVSEQKLNSFEYIYLPNSSLPAQIPVIIDNELYIVQAFGENDKYGEKVSSIDVLEAKSMDNIVAMYEAFFIVNESGEIELDEQDVFRTCNKNTAKEDEDKKLHDDIKSKDKLNRYRTYRHNVNFVTSTVNYVKNQNSDKKSEFYNVSRCGTMHCDEKCKHFSNQSSIKTHQLLIKMAIYAFIKSNLLEPVNRPEYVYAPVLYMNEDKVKCNLERHSDKVDVSFVIEN